MEGLIVLECLSSPSLHSALDYAAPWFRSNPYPYLEGPWGKKKKKNHSFIHTQVQTDIILLIRSRVKGSPAARRVGGSGAAVTGC